MWIIAGNVKIWIWVKLIKKEPKEDEKERPNKGRGQKGTHAMRAEHGVGAGDKGGRESTMTGRQSLNMSKRCLIICMLIKNK